jgi:tellurite resistance protein
MVDDKLEERRRSLEEAFFRRRDKELVERLRREQEQKGLKQAIADASGIRDEALLDRLAAAGAHPEALAAFSLVPLIAVAWADRKMDDRERKAVLSAAEQIGIGTGSPAYDMLTSWLDQRPDRDLLDAWEAYVKTPRANLSDEDRAQLGRDVLDRARKVAKATGGFLGLGDVSPSEREVLQRIERALGETPAA